MRERVAGWRLPLALLVCAATAAATDAAYGQTLTGRVLDSRDGARVATAGVFLLNRDGERVGATAADTAGAYLIELPGPGEYRLFVQRIGYFEAESPLFSVVAVRTYHMDVEVRPEPIPLDPISVSVRNETMESWLRKELGVNPHSIWGFRAYQGERLEAAKVEARDNTGMLRRLYIPVSHGRQVCFGYPMPSVQRGSRRMTEPGTGQIGEPPCGKLYVDGLPVPSEHIDSFDHRRIAVVAWIPPNLHLYTVGFDWTFDPGGH